MKLRIRPRKLRDSFKKGDLVCCINNDGLNPITHYLQKGQAYVVREIRDDEFDEIFVSSTTGSFMARRFMKIEI